jgi:hypothetical protein
MSGTGFKAGACALMAAGVVAMALHAEGGSRFPQVAATNLAGGSLSLPSDFGAPAALVFVAFARNQQPDIDAWKPFVDKARAKRPSLRAWELPMIGAGYKFMRGVIEGGMRSGIKGQEERERTVTLFLDSKPFAEAIGVAGSGAIALLVVAPDGRILGRASGGPSPASESAIEAALSAAFAAGR